MKKKLLTVALAATMMVASVFNALAATTATVDITGGLGSVNSGDEALTGNFDVSYTFTNASKDASANWNNFAVEVFSGTNFVTMRADAFGVGTGDYATPLGTWGGEALTTWTGAPADAAAWTAWAAGMANATVKVTVARTGNVLTFTYDIVAGGQTYKFVGVTPEIAGLPADLSIHLTGEKVALTNVVFKDNKAAGATTTAAGTAAGTTTAAAAAGATTTKASDTGDNTASTVALVTVAAVGAMFVVLASRKSKVTE